MKWHKDLIFKDQTKENFTEIALKVFRFQYENNATYRDFCNYIHTDVFSISSLEQIPFLPISFFKSHTILSSKSEPQKIFLSSGTTKQIRSKHYVVDLDYYHKSFQRSFEIFYGKPEDYAVLALLPSYQQQGDSSLIYMVDDFISKSKYQESGYFLKDYANLAQIIKTLQEKNIPILLIGVSYALLDLAEKITIESSNIIVMETGGMKGRRKELVKKELHQQLCKGLKVDKIHSEYGMTELLSQAYSKGNGLFFCPPWMGVIPRDINDALSMTKNKGGLCALNIIDLANVNSCCFIATDDLGRVYENNSFEVVGRLDISDIRGCNLMVI